MAFADPMPLRQRSAGMAGAMVIPAALGALLVTGLAVTDIITPPDDGTLIGIQLDPPKPPDSAKDQPDQPAITGPIVAPLPPLDLTSRPLDLDTTPIIPDPTGQIVKLPLLPVDTGLRAAERFEPVIPRPRNDPGLWITTSDYRSIWINREFTGTARFVLDISPSGKVSDCRITSSTGHGALDDATCRLITRRARFDPATDASGQAVAGTYSSSIRWVLPD